MDPEREPGTSAVPERPEPPSEAETTGLVRMGLLFYGAMLAAAVIWRIGFYHEPILYASVADEQEGLSLLRDMAIGVFAGGVLIGLSDWLTRTTPWGDRLARELAAALGRISVPDALLLAVASGVAEEVFFRGAVQPRTGWLVASLLFGCVHFVPRRELLPWTAFAILAGFLFGYLFIATGNLVAPITAHVLVNAVNLPALSRRYAEVLEEPSAASREEPGDGSGD